MINDMKAKENKRTLDFLSWVKNRKHFLLRFINFVLFLGLCFGYQNMALSRAKKEAMIEKKNQEALKAARLWKDGTYEGIGHGFGGPIKVKVTIEEGEIKSIDLLEAKSEDSAYLSNATSLLPKIIQKQNADVDVASGATYSSNGIKQAVTSALEGAKNQ